MEMADFTGKVAIVTGAGRGIGRGTALKLAAAGDRVVLAGIGDESIGKVKKEIEGMGGTALTVRTDISKWEDARNLADRR
jgi:NAD(P)-dependent dehydrogenase (short-subunit alcohol dehydrogenase family)